MNTVVIERFLGAVQSTFYTIAPQQIHTSNIGVILCCYLCQIALLKLLLAAAPTSKAKTDSINILADVLPEEMP